MGSIRGGLSNPIGIGVDLDCNVWVGNISARRIAKFSPGGKMLATAASADLVAQDIAVGRGGDVYAFDGSSRAIDPLRRGQVEAGDRERARDDHRRRRHGEDRVHAERRRVPCRGRRDGDAHRCRDRWQGRRL